MDIINTHISDDGNIPAYTFLCLKKLRDLNPEANIKFIGKSLKGYESAFKFLGVEFIEQDSIQSDIIDEFNSLSWLKKWGTPNTKYASPDFFFHRAMERIYYLSAYMCENNIKEVFHCENDVVTYYPISDIEKFFDGRCWVVPASVTSVTAAVLISSKEKLLEICQELNNLLKKGHDELLRLTCHDMVNEMSLLNLCQVSLLPILPKEDTMIFDPSSYGQYLGGTNNFGNEVGFTDMNHYIGEHIRKGVTKPRMINNKPYANDTKIFNLHIHSKKLKDFV